MKRILLFPIVLSLAAVAFAQDEIKVGDYIFRGCLIDPFQGTVMAKFALSKGWKKIAVLTDVKQDYSVGLAQFFKENFAKNGGQIVKEQSYSTGDKDFKAQLTSIKAS